MSEDIKTRIKAPVAYVFRRALIKRRLADTGLFEDEWVDISDDVKLYGKIMNQIDSVRRFKFTFGNAKLTVQNVSGRYNPSDSPTSLWYGYLNQQRTLVRIQAGFYYNTTNTSGVIVRNEVPSESLWDVDFWDADQASWDNDASNTVFTGILSGDILTSDKNDVSLNLRPLVSVFQDYPARNLNGFTSTGLTASQFVTMVRDHQDGSGNYIFRPFFGDTTSNWEISTTSNVFANLNTNAAKDVIDRTVWEVIEKLSEAENFIPYITRQGVFRFISRDSASTATAYEFHGAGSPNTEYGHTIKAVNSYGFKISKYYSRIQIKWRDEDTASAYEVVESTLTVGPSNNPWAFGVRTLEMENFYIPTSTVARTLAQTIFDDVSGFKREIDFTTSFVPHLDLLDRFSVFYDPAAFSQNNLWDLNNWADDDTNTSLDLIFDSADGDTITLEGQEFKFLSFEIDLDNFQNKFVAREL